MSIKAFWRQNGFSITFEFISIFVGLMLALWINNWNQARQDSNTAHTLMAKVVYELKQNSGRLTRNYDNLLAFEASINREIARLKDEKAPPETKLSLEISQSEYDDGVWSFAKNRAALNRIPVEDLLQAANAYQEQELAYRRQARLYDEDITVLLERLLDKNGGDDQEREQVLNALTAIHFKIQPTRAFLKEALEENAEAIQALEPKYGSASQAG
ncbi:hypothetical protein [Gallaecimonas sp. GXIMD4217]|uniref:hypothetical protein n=1 Tax=Gallaecimonas sp. GXIMD4217 TaxID=3131927 RepID=UPI00311AC19A